MEDSINIGVVWRDSGISGEGVVAADVSSAVEGGRPAARKERWKPRAALKIFSTVGVGEGFSAGRDAPALRQARCPPLRKSGGGMCADINMNSYMSQGLV